MLAHLALTLLCNGTPDAPLGASAGATMVLEKRPVRLEVPFEFRRRGGTARAREGVLFHVAVPDVSAFAPGGVGEPFFVYGAGVCDTLQSPFFAGGNAIVLCAVPQKREPAVLWLTRAGATSAALRGSALDAEYVSATARRRTVPVAPPAAGAPGVRVRDLSALRRAVFRAR